MTRPVLLEVGWSDPRLHATVNGLTAYGTCIVKTEATFSTTDIGTMLGYGGTQLGIFDYFALLHGGTAPENTPGDIYNNIWIIGDITGTGFTVLGQPEPVPNGIPYIVVDADEMAPDDQKHVIMGSLFWPGQFTVSDELSGQWEGYCINPFRTIWTSSGFGEQLRSNAQDSSGYFAESTYPIGGHVYQPENTFPTQWDAIFPPPNYTDFLGNHYGPDPQYPPVLICDAQASNAGCSVTATIKCPKTAQDLLNNPGPADCSVDSLRANVQLSGGLAYSVPPAQNCGIQPPTPPDGFEPDGYVARLIGADHRITIMYFLVGNCCSAYLDWVGWMVGIHTSKIPSVLQPPTLNSNQSQVP